MPLSIEHLYDAVTGDEDARVCKDIPESACHHQPRNFFAYLTANLLGKVADELASAKLMLPWLMGLLGAPVALIGFLVPIREAGVLLPQLVVAAMIRRLPRRRGVWMLGAMLSALSLFAMAWIAHSSNGTMAGLLILAALVVFSLARGLCSVSAKDVLGKTVSKSRRGVLMGWSASLSGLAILGVGLWLGTLRDSDMNLNLFSWLFMAAGIIWILACSVFAVIQEEPGATEGGGNALNVALAHLTLLRTDPMFRHFVITRCLLLAVALAAPYYTLLAQSQTGGHLANLGWLVIATGIGSALASPLWGKWADRSSRQVMAIAAAGHAALAFLVIMLVSLDAVFTQHPLFWATVMLLLTFVHAGVRLGRKVYLVDMANADNRAALVAVSNTVIGIAGLSGDAVGTTVILSMLGAGSLVAAVSSAKLVNVSAP